MTTTDTPLLHEGPAASEAHLPITETTPADPAGDASDPSAAAASPSEAPVEPPAETAPDAGSEAEPPSSGLAEVVPDRRRIEEQLAALRRRESELRRELAKADHPELAEAIGGLEACVYRVSRADGKLAQGLTKAEQRRRDTLSKKLGSLTEKRDALDAQIAELQGELAGLGEERIQGYRDERREALQRLVAHLGAHTAGLRAADLDAADLVPEIGDWMDEIRSVAEELAATRR